MPSKVIRQTDHPQTFMKTLTLLCAAALMFPLALRSEDFISPKPANAQSVRVLLYINGSSRILDYGDVARVHCSEPAKIVFETVDGFMVVHQGAYTVVQPRPIFTEHHARGVKFYDAK